MIEKKVMGAKTVEVCEKCGVTLPLNRHGYVAYKSLQVLRAGLPPVSLKVCRGCWSAAVSPAQHERAEG